ncbi:MAG: hypothetical protein WD896_00480 [Parcubacteria group bacterium]
MDTSRDERFRRAQRAFEAFAECVHGSFSLYCKHCRDPHNILDSRTRTGKFRDSIAQLEEAGLLDDLEIYEPARQVHRRITLGQLAKTGIVLIGSLLVYETLRHKEDLKGVVLHFFQKKKNST